MHLREPAMELIIPSTRPKRVLTPRGQGLSVQRRSDRGDVERILLVSTYAPPLQVPLPEQPANKQCRRCQDVRPAAAFQIDRHNADGLQSYCRE